ncbi:hypothetical protein NE237_014071 [Protea cynaroides]|uniref:Uncharacterized protein n=1 Tax=Protea cynaroides TaxID=273540 RepID=A0A9Q0K0R4_9MAGN|nr:hypothetical protein NE237_014071 [Protea cynaroides]
MPLSSDMMVASGDLQQFAVVHAISQVVEVSQEATKGPLGSSVAGVAEARARESSYKDDDAPDHLWKLCKGEPRSDQIVGSGGACYRMDPMVLVVKLMQTLSHVGVVCRTEGHKGPHRNAQMVAGYVKELMSLGGVIESVAAEAGAAKSRLKETNPSMEGNPDLGWLLGFPSMESSIVPSKEGATTKAGMTSSRSAGSSHHPINKWPRWNAKKKKKALEFHETSR